MGIENRNTEIPSIEIMNTSKELAEQNLADHKANSEKLDNFSLVDIEGERDQLDTKEEISKSKEGDSKLLPVRKIEDETPIKAAETRRFFNTQNSEYHTTHCENKVLIPLRLLSVY